MNPPRLIWRLDPWTSIAHLIEVPYRLEVGDRDLAICGFRFVGIASESPDFDRCESCEALA